MEFNEILHAIAYLFELIGAILLAKNFISIKTDQLIEESASGWFGPPNPIYIKRMLLLIEETKLGILFIIVGIFIKILLHLTKQPFNKMFILVILFIIIGYILLLLAKSIIKSIFEKKAFKIANQLLIGFTEKEGLNGYISKVGDNLVFEISRGANESDAEFAKRIIKLLRKG